MTTLIKKNFPRFLCPVVSEICSVVHLSETSLYKFTVLSEEDIKNKITETLIVN